MARSNPDGSKKTVRKTYKGHIKRVLKLSGNFDSVKKEIEAPDTLWSMMAQPNEVWDSQFGHASKEIETGLPQQVTGQLSKAMTMARGIIPKDAWNNSVLGELVTPSTPSDVAKLAQNSVKKPLTQTAMAPRPGKVEGPRPKRNIKKRTYGDASFEGYGEGYVDDDAQDGGYSTGDGDDRTGRKRPKKVCQTLCSLMTWLTDKDCTVGEFSRTSRPTKQLWTWYGRSVNVGSDPFRSLHT